MIAHHRYAKPWIVDVRSAHGKLTDNSQVLDAVAGVAKSFLPRSEFSRATLVYFSTRRSSSLNKTMTSACHKRARKKQKSHVPKHCAVVLELNADEKIQTAGLLLLNTIPISMPIAVLEGPVNIDAADRHWATIC